MSTVHLGIIHHVSLAIIKVSVVTTNCSHEQRSKKSKFNVQKMHHENAKMTGYPNFQPQAAQIFKNREKRSKKVNNNVIKIPQ